MPADHSLQFVRDRWDDAAVAGRSPVGRLVYRSNILGDDLAITNTGGGNTSSKAPQTDPLTGEQVDVLWVKGSGGDLRTAKAENFSSLYMDRLNHLQKVYDAEPEKGVKTPVEDSMVDKYRHCTFNLNPRASSIDTPLHAFAKYRHVDHMHPNAVIAVAASKRQQELMKEIWGDELFYFPWQRPGFDLGLVVQRGIAEHPHAVGALMGGHGLMTWHDDDRTCYETTLRIIDQAAKYIADHDQGEQTFGGAKYQTLPEDKRRGVLVEILPWLRGCVSQVTRFVGTVQTDDKILRFVNSRDAQRLAALGTSCPDHFLRTKIRPLFVDWNPQSESVDDLKKKLSDGLTQYQKDYEAYYQRCKHPDSPAMRPSNPTVVLIPGVGMIAWGKNKSESRVTAEFYNCAVEVMRGAEAIDEYTALPEQEAFDIEYWLLEEAKLKRMPPEQSLARKVVAVVGAGSGIGKAVAHRIVGEGAAVVCVDLDEEAAKATAAEIVAKHGEGIGVAGSGISNCGPAIGLKCNVTDRAGIRVMLEDTLLAYGGLDAVVVTAGLFVPPDKTGHIADDKWAATFAVNVTGPYLVCDEAAKVVRAQQLPASIVITTSANAVVAKKGSQAYDTSKAAANHLVRELAVELAPLCRVNGVAPATVVEGSSMFPRDRVIASLTKYDIAHDESESTESLRDKLANFYAGRTLTKVPITTADQAEAVYLLLTDQLAKTTGQVIAVDGGLVDAFLR